MFIITNTTNNEISISDLGITIFSKQAIDLHKIELKIPLERSKDLNFAIEKKYIKIINQDKKEEPKIIKEVKNDNKELFEGLKEIITSEIQKQLGNNQKQDVSELSNIISKLTDTLKKDDKLDIYSEINEKQISEIHKKVSEKMSKNTENTVEYSKKEITDKSLSDTSELENLI